jgi:ABC-type spermidine/putrescine transport system permease subunit II
LPCRSVGRRWWRRAWSYLALPPGLDTLQRRVFGLVHSGVEEQVAAISLVMIAASAVLAVLIVRLMTGGIALRRRRTGHL